MPFADILKQINEETDRSQVEALAQKYPVLRQFAEDGETLAAIRPRLKALEPEYENQPGNALTELERWRTWKGQHFDAEKGKTREEVRLQTALTDAQAKITELEARGDADMTPEEIRALVREEFTAQGVATSKAVEDRLVLALSPNGKDGKPGEVYKLVLDAQNGIGNRFEDLYDKIESARDDYEQNFGERIRPKALFDHMGKMAEARKVPIAAIDAAEAAKDLMAPKLAEKQAKDHQAEVEKARTEGIAEGEKKARASGGRSMPVSGDRGTAIGVAETRKFKKDGDGKFPLKFGSGGRAREWMQQRAEEHAAAGQ